MLYRALRGKPKAASIARPIVESDGVSNKPAASGASASASASRPLGNEGTA